MWIIYFLCWCFSLQNRGKLLTNPFSALTSWLFSLVLLLSLSVLPFSEFAEYVQSLLFGEVRRANKKRQVKKVDVSAPREALGVTPMHHQSSMREAFQK